MDDTTRRDIVEQVVERIAAFSESNRHSVDNELSMLFNRGRPSRPQMSELPAVINQPVNQPTYQPTYNLRTSRGQRPRRFQALNNQNATFCKEVILLPDNSTQFVPRRAVKAWLFENGHIKSALEFCASWNSEKIMETITVAFQPVVVGCRLQILLPCHNKLVEPSLTARQTLNGALVKKLFHQKSIYVRPDRVILREEKQSSCSDADNSNANSSDFAEISDGDKWETVSIMSTADNQSISNNAPSIGSDDVIWCVTTATVTTDEPVTASLLNCPAASAPADVQCSPANNTSDVCSGATHPNASGSHSCSTPYSKYLDLFEEEYLSDDPEIQEAISRSLDSDACVREENISLDRILTQIASQVTNENTTRFNIIRKNVWDGASRAMGRSNFSPHRKVDIKFTDDYGISEGAVDNGGPTREFFRLCLNEIKDKIGIFEGPPSAKVLTCNSKAMKENGYLYAGQIMAMSVAHGGQNPCFLSELLYECLHKGPDNVTVKTAHISDGETRLQVESILLAETESQLQDALARAANLITLAGHNVVATLRNKEETALDLAHWYVLQRTRAPFERFREGLMSLGVLDAIKRYPHQLKCLFVKTNKALIPTDVENLFQICYSERGSNAFNQECRTLAFWQDYLQDAECEDGVSLEEILVFVTGCDSIPALGFSPKPTLDFTYSQFPQANTCGNVLHLPIHTEYTAFKADMDFGIRNSPGFGRA